MTEREELIYESYLAAHMALQEGTIDPENYAAVIIYNIMLHDLDGILDATPVELAAEQLLDIDEFAVRVHELVTEFLQFAIPNTYESVYSGLLTREEAGEQVSKMLGDVLAGDFVEKVTDVADLFIEALGEYSNEEIAAACLFGCHPEVLRESRIRFIIDDAVDYPKES